MTEKEEFKERVHAWAQKLGARVTSVSLRPMTTKWASYSTAGRLTFDTSLLRVRREVQEYVIAHELLHFHAPNHGKLWKSLMRAHLGDYERLEGELRNVAQRTRKPGATGARGLPEGSQRHYRTGRARR